MAERFLLCLDDADRIAGSKEKHVIGGTGVGVILADGLACAFMKVDGLLVLNGPTGRTELSIDRVPGNLFRVLVGNAGHIWKEGGSVARFRLT